MNSRKHPVLKALIIVTACKVFPHGKYHHVCPDMYISMYTVAVCIHGPGHKQSHICTTLYIYVYISAAWGSDALVCLCT